MTFLENLAWLLPLVSFGVIGFTDADGGNGDGDKKNDQDDPKKDKKEDDNGDDDVDPKIKEIQQDPDAIAAILKKKRDANAEAKKLRLENEELKRKQKEVDDQTLKDQEKYKELAEKKDVELKEKDALFKAQLILQALKAEAMKQGIVDTDLVSLISIDDITVKDDYSLEGIDAAVEAFKEKKPDFFKEGNDDGNNTNKSADDKKPGLRKKVQGTEENLSPVDRIEKGLRETKKT